MMNDNKLQISLLLLRLSVFLVMAMWTLDKFVNPAHAATVYEHFYFISGLGANPIYVIGALESALLLAFVIGHRKTFSYGVVLALHCVSTLSSFSQYLNPFDGPNLLFFAAWPMLAACVALFLLREEDKLLTVG